MSRAQRPRLASWLLRRFVAGPQRESLIGDLDEQFVRGRSSLWYWRQVLSAMVYTSTQDLRAHKILALRALLCAWVLTGFWGTYGYQIFHFDEFLFVTGLTNWFYLNGYGMPAILQHGPVIGAFGWAMSGWAVGRLHRPYSMSMVLLCVAVAAVTFGWRALGQPGELLWLWVLVLPFAMGGLFSASRPTTVFSDLGSLSFHE